MSKSPFLAHIQDYMFQRRYSKRTIETYLLWIRCYILFHNKPHPASMGDTQVEEFLNHLLLEKHVASQTQEPALNYLCFLYRHIIKQPISVKLELLKVSSPANYTKLPVVLTQDEKMQLIEHIPPQ